MKRKFYLQTILVAAILIAAKGIQSWLLGVHTPLSHWGWITLSYLLTTYVLSMYAVHISGRTPIQRWMWLLIVSFTIGSFSILIEAFIFNVTTMPQTAKALGEGLFEFTVLSALLIYFFREPHAATVLTLPAHSIPGWVWRIASSTFLYIFFYFAAGMILQATLPALHEFYEGKIPPIAVILETQVARGLMLSLTGLLFTATCSLSGRRKALLFGALLSVLGGIAPLILPNDLMPAALRMGHAFEVGISNFLYGFLVVRILSESRPRIANAKASG